MLALGAHKVLSLRVIVYEFRRKTVIFYIRECQYKLNTENRYYKNSRIDEESSESISYYLFDLDLLKERLAVFSFFQSEPSSVNRAHLKELANLS